MSRVWSAIGRIDVLISGAGRSGKTLFLRLVLRFSYASIFWDGMMESLQGNGIWLRGNSSVRSGFSHFTSLMGLCCTPSEEEVCCLDGCGLLDGHERLLLGRSVLQSDVVLDRDVMEMCSHGGSYVCAYLLGVIRNECWAVCSSFEGCDVGDCFGLW